MYKIAVCDDSEQCLANAVVLTKNILLEERITGEIFEYRDGTELLADIKNGAKFHILLLDVMMDSLDGITIASVLREQKDKISIVFMSYNREMAIHGYEVSAVRYLAKPIQKEKLREALLCCIQDEQKKKRILLSTKKGQCRIDLSDIKYAEAWERGTKFTLEQGQEETSVKFSELEFLLPEKQFVLIHRAYVVNLAYVKYIRTNEVELITGELLPISRLRNVEVKRKFINYLES